MASKIPNGTGGYLGLISILITASLIALWAITHSPLTNQDVPNTNDVTSTSSKTPIEAAKEAVRNMENRQQDLDLSP